MKFKLNKCRHVRPVLSNLLHTSATPQATAFPPHQDTQAA